MVPQQKGALIRARLFDTMSQRWALRRDIPLAILAWTGVVIVGLWLLSHIVNTLLVLIVAALLAYALSPAVAWLRRFMPRPLAILIVYALVFAGLGVLGYLVFDTSARQFLRLTDEIRALSASNGGKPSPLIQSLLQLGFTQQQIDYFSQQVLASVQGIAGQIVPVVIGIFSTMLDIIVITVTSVYLLIDGQRVKTWMQTRIPLTQRERVSFFLDTLERVVGGYIRGQLTMSVLIGVLVGVGMALFHVPYFVLLGFLAFVLEFIPVLGTLTSGVICVVVALTQGWLIALGVLIYFIVVHIIEGDILGPRIVGRAVGLHPAASLIALLAGAELFGVWGALFAAPVAGMIQAFVKAGWMEWQDLHPEQFTHDPAPVATPPSDLAAAPEDENDAGLPRPECDAAPGDDLAPDPSRATDDRDTPDRIDQRPQRAPVAPRQ